MSEVIVRELWNFPVKGCQGVRTDTLEITKMGVTGDRSFVLWKDGKLVDQIETPQLASLRVGLDTGQGVLCFQHPEQGRFEHQIRSKGESRATKWLYDEFETIDQGDEAARWLSSTLGKELRLVSPGPAWKINFPIPEFQRLHQEPKQRFFSASPVSLANQASLDDLNARLEQPVPMDRFRMNVVVEGLAPYQEDEVDSLANDDVELLQVTPAERCIIITTDQQTGERPKSDLMKVLKEYRRKPKEERFGSGLIFGSYMGVGKEGTLRVGDRLGVELA